MDLPDVDNTEEFRCLSLCSGCGGMDLGLEKAGFKCVGQVEIMKFALKILKRHWPKVPKYTDILTLLRSGFLVKIYRTQTQKAKVSRAKKALSSLNVCELFSCLFRNGYLSRMCPDFFRFTKDGILRLSCKSWPKAGTGIAGTFWTVNGSESPKDAKDCLLVDILEDSVPLRYYLSRKAVAGILRRTEKYNRGGYVLRLEQEKGKTRRLKRLSLQQFKRMITKNHRTDNLAMSAILSQIQSKAQIQNYEKLDLEKTILRKLTPLEKERLQGFPEGWTLPEGSSLVMQFQCQSQNG